MYNNKKHKDLYLKSFIVIIFICIIMYLIYKLIKSNNNIFKSLIHGKDANVPSVPKLHFYGRSLGETISIYAFARALKTKGYNWDTIVTGYRPDYLKNQETGKNLEIDAYHPESKIGIEYNGIQHYIYPNIFHKSREEFDKCVQRDKLKYQLAKENGIKLIVIPYHIDTCKHKNNKYYCIKRCRYERENLIYNYIIENM